MSDFWNKMYDGNEFIYGEEPNKFFAGNIKKYEPGKILLPADGEGRNGVYAAKLGWDVFCFDVSDVGKNKALKLAEKNNVQIDYNISDFKKLNYEENSFDCIVLTYLHFINHKEKHFQIFLDKYLKIGGIVILEGFSKKHFGRKGGPQNVDMLFDLNEIKNDFKNYTVLISEEEDIFLNEGTLHNGECILVRFVGEKK